VPVEKDGVAVLVGAVIGGDAGFFSERQSVRNDARSIEPPEKP